MTDPNDDYETVKKKLNSLEEEMKYLQEDLLAADEEVESFEGQIKKLEGRMAIFLNNIQVLEEIKHIFATSLHNVTICTPTIDDLDKLDLFSVASSVVIKASCFIDPALPQHQKLMDEMKSFDNISLRLYDGKDRWTILKDREILFMAIEGNTPNQFLSFKTEDAAHINVFNTLMMETWLRGQNIG